MKAIIPIYTDGYIHIINSLIQELHSGHSSMNSLSVLSVSSGARIKPVLLHVGHTCILEVSRQYAGQSSRSYLILL